MNQHKMREMESIQANVALQKAPYIQFYPRFDNATGPWHLASWLIRLESKDIKDFYFKYSLYDMVGKAKDYENSPLFGRQSSEILP